MGTVLLCRHGETAWNRESRIQGWAPTTLTDRGREQSAALAAHVRARYDPDRLLGSDLLRAQETARELARETGLDPTFAAGWRERDFGYLQGLPADELFERFPQHSLADVGHAAAAEAPDSGESLLSVRERVLAAWQGLRADLEAGTAVVVTHGGPLALLLGSLRRRDVVASVFEGDLDNCGLTELRLGDGAATVVRENATGFLPA